MYIHGRIPMSTTNGPGRRAVLHVQGCTLGCPGCWNPKSHKHGSGEETSTTELAHWVFSLKDVEGITFSGGEPMQQAPVLYSLIRAIKTKNPAFSIGMFTGYTRQELQSGKYLWFDDKRMLKGSDRLWLCIASNLDFAVMGRYNQKLRTQDKPLCGSSNQTIELFSDRYKLSDFQPQSAEIVISADGRLVNITGFPKAHELLKAGL